MLAQLPGRKWMVLGDMAELGDHAIDSHREIGVAAREQGVERLFTHGALAALAAESFRAGAGSGQQAETHLDGDSLLKSLQEQLSAEVRLLVKGSRVNRLERVVAGLGAAAASRKAS